MVNNPWAEATWNLTEQSLYYKRYGRAKAEYRAQEAGTTLGALRPHRKYDGPPMVIIQRRFMGATGATKNVRSSSATIILEAGASIYGGASSEAEITYTLFGDEMTATGLNTLKKLTQGQLATAIGALYTAPVLTTTLIKSIHLADAGGAGATGIQLFVGGPAIANAITGAFNISSGGWAVYTDDGWRFFNNAGQILGTGTGGNAGRTFVVFKP